MTTCPREDVDDNKRRVTGICSTPDRARRAASSWLRSRPPRGRVITLPGSGPPLPGAGDYRIPRCVHNGLTPSIHPIY